MFSLIGFLVVLALLLFFFGKPIATWFKSPSDPFATQLSKLEAKEQAVFGKRTASPAPPAAVADTKAPLVPLDKA